MRAITQDSNIWLMNKAGGIFAALNHEIQFHHDGNVDLKLNVNFVNIFVVFYSIHQGTTKFKKQTNIFNTV